MTNTNKTVVEIKKEFFAKVMQDENYTEYAKILETMSNSVDRELNKKATKNAENANIENVALTALAKAELKASELATVANCSTQKASYILRTLEQNGKCQSRQEKTKIYFI